MATGNYYKSGPQAIENYNGYQLHIGEIVNNPNGRKTQTVLIYKDDKFVGGSYADIELENAITKSQKKVDHLNNGGNLSDLYK